MTPDDIDRPAATGPRRTARFNGMIIGLVVLLLVGAGVYVWVTWSVSADDVAAEAREHPVQPSELPPANPGALSPEGAEQVRAAPPE